MRAFTVEDGAFVCPIRRSLPVPRVGRRTRRSGSCAAVVARLPAVLAVWVLTSFAVPAGAGTGAPDGTSGAPYPGPVTAAATALDFAGTNAFVKFDGSGPLALPAFTLELWFRRDGAGVATTTGADGLADVVPMIARGSDESEKANQDINYLLGIRVPDGVLAADFEEGPGGAVPSRNHPIAGTTPVGFGIWHHAAATYDGTTWRLYLDGTLEAEQVVGQPPASASTVLFSLASALNSKKKPQGYYDGAIDEVRVWDHARTAEEIQAAANAQITDPAPGLIGRWAMDEGSGNRVYGSAGTGITGSIQNNGYAWTAGAPFDLVFDRPPVVNAAPEPADGAPFVSRPAALEVRATDPEGAPVTVTFFGRMAPPGALAPPFTLIGLPDTQYYVGRVNGGIPEMFHAQTQWIAARRAADNIVYVGHLGDCVENGDNGGDPVEWLAADAAMRRLEDPIATGLAEGIPFGVCVGNHDKSPLNDPEGTTVFYNQFFGVSRFAGRSYYGGHHGSNNDNWYELFGVGALDFIVISMEFDDTPDPAVLAWADQLLATHADRRGIVLSHYLCGTGNPAVFSPQGQAIYDALKDRENLILMLGGHKSGEGRREDVFEGRRVHTLLSDYQSRVNGGDGWLRVLRFSPGEDLVRVRTYSPWLDAWEADADSSSQFTLDVRLSGVGPFVELGRIAGVPSGGTAGIDWPGLAADTTCQWYVTLDDGRHVVRGPTWSFRTAEGVAPQVTVLHPNGGETYPVGEEVAVSWDASDNVGVASVRLMLSRGGPGGPFEEVASGLANTGSYLWTVSGPYTTDACFEVVASDAAGNVGADISDAPFAIGGATDVPLAQRRELSLGPVIPNPTSGTARISFEVPVEADVRVEVFDVQGRRAAVLAEGTRSAGRYELIWDGRDGTHSAEPGLYFVRMSVADRALVRRFARIR